MKKLLAILTLLISTNVYSSEKQDTLSEKKVSPIVEKVCKSLSDTYLTAFQKAADKVNYTDMMFTVATNYDGNQVGMYLIMHTIETAYNDSENNIERFHGAASFKQNCYNDELIQMIKDDAKNNPTLHIEEKILTNR